ncbi:glutamate ABC transporter substrate-binding protein (plasmid) [Bartonella sp. HY329]|uniref:glutamate ABC transporter substrate-binding protein n=1 Tax=unclassified Bartonella TaxID=2645622 RepID=UPI0021CAD63D|nr:MULTISPECIES: glutamate ABC transporter substrate-binding protein [unclassified Bartonella]UXM96623.1 glutamate ABC transporter substrate-binding protein [Bartonella sp. HY329]UXN10946.1 glutamate ABC transporter substrate-binding protein [Bartonella sp. HY328]
MKKILSTLSAFAWLLGVSAAGAQDFPANSTMAKLQEKGQLHIGVKFDQPLFGLRNLSGKPVGFDIEIAKLIAKKLGIEESNIIFVETSSANREPFLQQKKVDYVVATYAMNDKRKKVLDFAGPYVIGGQDLIVQKGNPKNIKGPHDLAGKKVCVMNGSEGQSAIVNNYPDAQIVPFDVISKCVGALKNGSVDAVATTNFILAGLVSREPNKIEIVGNMFTREPWGVGIRKDEKDFCQFVQTVLIDADKDGTYKELYDKFLQDYVPGDGKLPPLDPCE